MNRPTIHQRAAALAALTADAYSAKRYGSWRAAAKELLRMGLTDVQVEAVLRSKWMRWAADWANIGGRAPASVIVRWIRKEYPSQAKLERALADLMGLAPVLPRHGFDLIMADWKDTDELLEQLRKTLQKHGLLLQSWDTGSDMITLTVAKQQVSAERISNALGTSATETQ